MTPRRARVAALLVAVVALVAGCSRGGEPSDGAARTATADGGTSTTFDTSKLQLRTKLAPLEGSEVVIAPAIVSELGSEPIGGGGAAASTIGASQAARVQGILSELGATRTSAGIVVTLPERVLFDFDKADIRPDAASTLEKVAQVVRANPASPIEVQGHTDATGSDDYNQRLSERRAEAVKNHLVSVHQIEAARVRAVGFGEKNPVAPNTTDENRQRNRRVEIVIGQA